MNKKIHYCWFGRGKKGKIFKKCLKSWKKYFPDYEIIEWNEDNFDINCNDYVKKAYELKKFAFVSDYARLKIIYENGGIYFDTDVEVVKRIDDQILSNGYLGEESPGVIATGLGFSAPSNNKAIELMMKDYENFKVDENIEGFNLVPCPIKNTKALVEKGYIIKDFASIEGLTVYPSEYFCGYDIENNCINTTNKTYTIHHYNASWLNHKDRIKLSIKKVASRIIGKKNYSKLRKIKKKANREV